MIPYYLHGRIHSLTKLGMAAEAKDLAKQLDAAVDDESKGRAEYLDMAEEAEEAGRPKIKAMAESHAADELKHFKEDQEALTHVD